MLIFPFVILLTHSGSIAHISHKLGRVEIADDEEEGGLLGGGGESGAPPGAAVDDAVRDQVLAGAASADAANRVSAFERIPSAVDTSVAPLTLLDALYAPKDSALQRVVEIMLRLENISHILVWSRGDAEDAAVDALPATSVRKLERVEPSIDYIELPRLALSFRCESVPVGSKGHCALRLYCEQHEGMYLSVRMPSTATGVVGVDQPGANIQKIAHGLPQSLLLEDGDGRFFLLVAATVKPRRVRLPPAAARGDVTAGITEEVELLMDRKDPLWVSNVGKTRHYLYPIHISRAFFSTPSLASALYMLMMRMYNAQYCEACRLITSCVSDSSFLLFAPSFLFVCSFLLFTRLFVSCCIAVLTGASPTRSSRRKSSKSGTSSPICATTCTRTRARRVSGSGSSRTARGR